MPIPAAVLIPAISDLVGQGANAYSQGRMNKKMRKWNEKMHNIQRQEALADFTAQNKYNSPVEQMKRLREAGLNPNLVYGEGATATGGQVRSSGVESWNPTPPQFDIGKTASEGLHNYYDTQVKQATIDNMLKQNTVLTNEAFLKEVQALSTIANTDATKFDLSQRERLADIQAQMKEGELKKTLGEVEKLGAETTAITDQNERAAAMQAPNLVKAVEEILTLRLGRANTRIQMLNTQAQTVKTKAETEKIRIEKMKIGTEIEHIRSQIHNISKDVHIKELDIKLKEMGVQPGDKWFWRVLGQALGESGKKTPKSVSDYYKHNQPKQKSFGGMYHQ